MGKSQTSLAINQCACATRRVHCQRSWRASQRNHWLRRHGIVADPSTRAKRRPNRCKQCGYDLCLKLKNQRPEGERTAWCSLNNWMEKHWHNSMGMMAENCPSPAGQRSRRGASVAHRKVNSIAGPCNLAEVILMVPFVFAKHQGARFGEIF